MDFKKKLRVLNPEVRKSFMNLLKELEKNIDYLYTIATIDEKTGLYNNKFFNTLSKIELEKAKRGKSMSLLVIDLDKFKRVNDTYGHLVGDKILERLAKILLEQVRKYDIVSRFGGEEFFVLFPDTNLKKAKKVAERLRKRVEGDKFMKKYTTTMSGGVSEYGKGDSINKMTKRADKALYKAKENGRNRIEVEELVK
jgi:diguanylate cyclase (GGDEF)-like protein